MASGGSVRNGAPTDYRGLWKEYDSYLVKCEFLPSNERIEIVKKTTIKTLPCSKKTDPDSLDIRNAKLGEEFDTIGLYINSYDNCWYKVLVNGEVGYIYSGDTQWRGSNEPSYTFSGVAAPSSLSRGSRFSIKGELRGRLCEIGLVSGWISERNGATIYHCEDNVAGKYYSLLNSDIDMAMLFNELPVGEYTYTVFATLESYFILDGDLEKQEYGEVLIEKAFSVK